MSEFLVGFHIKDCEEILDFYKHIEQYTEIKLIKVVGIRVLSLPDMVFDDIMFSSLDYDLNKLKSVIGFDYCDILTRHNDYFVFDVIKARITEDNTLSIANGFSTFAIYSNNELVKCNNSLMVIYDKNGELEICLDLDLGDAEIYLKDIYMYGNSHNKNKYWSNNTYTCSYIVTIKNIKLGDALVGCIEDKGFTMFMGKCIVHLDYVDTPETLIFPSNTTEILLDSDYCLHKNHTLVIPPSVDSITVLNSCIICTDNGGLTLVIPSKTSSKLLIDIYINILCSTYIEDEFKISRNKADELLNNIGTGRFIELLNAHNIRVEIY